VEEEGDTDREDRDEEDRGEERHLVAFSLHEPMVLEQHVSKATVTSTQPGPLSQESAKGARHGA
jgi:hypothetical protein